MNVKYYTCEEWLNEPSFYHVLKVCDRENFLISSEKTIKTVSDIKCLIHGDKLYKITKAEAVLLI